MDKPTRFKAKKGLEGIIFDTTRVSNVVPEQKSLYYRGYPVHELAERCQFEEVAHLLLHGELPTQTELKAFCDAERSARGVSDSLIEVLQRFPRGGAPDGCHSYGRQFPRNGRRVLRRG